jgi:NAD(P)-dependent dehydrogenase (short-subunit alcohol dehydrogenase family)
MDDFWSPCNALTNVVQIFKEKGGRQSATFGRQRTGQGVFSMEPSSPIRPAVVITGASTGIGAASAQELAGLGFCVFAGVRKEPDGERLKAASPAIIPLMLDVTDAAQIAAAADTVGRAVGSSGLAGLVNNAGIVVAGPIELLPLDQWRRQLEINVIGQVAVTQALLPLLRKAGGRIVNISSVNGRIAPPYLAAYSASKHALEAINNALRSELRAWGIRVSIIEPGATATPIWDKSLTAASGLAEKTCDDLVALYKNDLDSMINATRELARAALPVDSVVRCIVHALTARRPKARYPVGLKVNLLLRAHKWIPDRIWDWIVQRSLGLPKVKRP